MGPEYVAYLDSSRFRDTLGSKSRNNTYIGPRIYKWIIPTSIVWGELRKYDSSFPCQPSTCMDSFSHSCCGSSTLAYKSKQSSILSGKNCKQGVQTGSHSR